MMNKIIDLNTKKRIKFTKQIRRKSHFRLLPEGYKHSERNEEVAREHGVTRTYPDGVSYIRATSYQIDVTPKVIRRIKEGSISLIELEGGQLALDFNEYGITA